MFGDLLWLAWRWAERIWPTSGARAQRGRMEQDGAKPRGLGLGQRNIKFLIWQILK